MTPVIDRAVLVDRFSRRYREAQSELLRKIERGVFGCAYGVTSWTTLPEARNLAEMLAIAPGKRLLEVGAGAGWPGLFLARVTGCDVALIDLPFDGLRIAAARADADRIADRCWPVLADGAALPLGNDAFDAICHSDVLCCLAPKREVLKECRRVIRDDGKMVFSVVSIAPGLSRDDYERAIGYGPEFIEAPADYPAMLQDAGWEMTDYADLSAEFLNTVRAFLEAEERNRDAMIRQLGEDKYQERITGKRKRIDGLVSGLIRRELFCVAPVAKR